LTISQFDIHIVDCLILHGSTRITAPATEGSSRTFVDILMKMHVAVSSLKKKKEKVAKHTFRNGPSVRLHFRNSFWLVES